MTFALRTREQRGANVKSTPLAYSTENDWDFLSFRNCACPALHNPALYADRPSIQAARYPQPPAQRKNQASQHFRWHDCRRSRAVRVSSCVHRWIDVNIAAIIRNAVSTPRTFTYARQVLRADRRLAVTAWNIEYIIRLTQSRDTPAQVLHQPLPFFNPGSRPPCPTRARPRRWSTGGRASETPGCRN